MGYIDYNRRGALDDVEAGGPFQRCKSLLDGFIWNAQSACFEGGIGYGGVFDLMDSQKRNRQL